MAVCRTEEEGSSINETFMNLPETCHFLANTD